MDHRAHIVVVEDEATQRQLLVDYLAKQNFRVSGADGGTALRKLLERELPALVLLDIGLPGEDGFVLARWLRERSGRIGIRSGLRPAPTITSPSRSSRANCLRGSRACCAARPARPPAPVRACAWAAASSTSKSVC